jgi:hypothetical protein
VTENQNNDAAQAEDLVAPAHDPDASNYVLQPTAHELPAFFGNPPPGRFMEEVHKGSDELVGKKSDQREAHPEENRAALGIGPDDKVPDTSGRGAHNRRSS